MAKKKVTALPENTSPALEDLLHSIDDPDGTPISKKVSMESVLSLTGGSLVLLDTQTASDSASLDFTVLENSVYDELIFELINIVPATDGAQLSLRMSTDGGSTYDSGANYGWLKSFWYPTSGSVTGANTGHNEIDLGVTIDNVAGYGGINATVKLFGLGNASVRKQLFYDAFQWANDEKLYRSIGGGIYHETSNDVDAFQILMSSGNITSGIARLYGVKKSGIVSAQKGLVLLESVIEATGVASIDLENWYSSEFDEYQIEVLNLIPVTDTAELHMRMSTDGGSTYDSGSNYGTAVFYIRDGVTSDSLGENSGGSRILLSDGLSNTVAQGGVSGELKLINPGSTVFYKGLNFHLSMIHSTSDYLYSMMGTSKYFSTSAVNAFQFYMSSGNIIGTVRVYGIRK